MSPITAPPRAARYELAPRVRTLPASSATLASSAMRADSLDLSINRLRSLQPESLLLRLSAIGLAALSLLMF